MSTQPEQYKGIIEYHKPTAAERAQTEWGIGKSARTLTEFAEWSNKFPDRDDASEEYDDMQGSITLGYN